MPTNKPIRIAHIMGKMVGGGVESVVMNYYKNIDKTKIQFDFICDKDSTNIPKEEIESLGGKVIIIPPYQHLKEYTRELKQVFKENNYKIVHSHINTLSFFPLLIAKKCKIPIRIAHSHSTTNKKEWKKNILKNILRPFSKINATNYYACSKLAGSWLFGRKSLEQGKITIINNAINLDNFIYNEDVREKMRKELGIKDKTLVIGHIGRFVDQKNHTFLLEIFNEILKQNPNSILLLAGTGPLLEEIKHKSNELNISDKILFLGQRKDANNLYQAMDIFLLPSLYEGLPVVGIEAQTSGLLCILSESMTKETKVLKTTSFISLQALPKYWATEILEKTKNFKRKNTKKELQDNGFDIKLEAKKLENNYHELYQGLIKKWTKKKYL